MAELLARVKFQLRKVFDAEDVSVLYYDSEKGHLNFLNPVLNDSSLQKICEKDRDSDNPERRDKELGETRISSADIRRAKKNLTDYLSNARVLRAKNKKEKEIVTQYSVEIGQIVRKVLHGGQVIAEFDIDNQFETPQESTKRSKASRNPLKSKEQPHTEKVKVFDENYSGKVSRIKNAFMMRLETSKKKIVGVVQVLNFGSNYPGLRKDDFIALMTVCCGVVIAEMVESIIIKFEDRMMISKLHCGIAVIKAVLHESASG